MIIGNLTSTSSNYADTEGKYKFHLVWGGLQVDSSEINKEVTWTQKSWLEDSTISEFEEIGTSGHNSGISGKDFIGLGESSYSKCVIDGDASSHSNWWNCVGLARTHNSNSDTGIPGPLGKIASSMHLYIWAPGNL